MKTILALLGTSLLFAVRLSHGAEVDANPPPAKRLKIGVVQMAIAPAMSENRDRIVAGIANAAGRGVRVVVFPEGALRGEGNAQPA